MTTYWTFARYSIIAIVKEEMSDGDGRSGETAGAGRAAIAARPQAGGGGAIGGRAAPDGISVARCAQRGGHRGAARDEQGRASRTIGWRRAREAARDLGGGCAGCGLRHRSVDAQARAPDD